MKQNINTEQNVTKQLIHPDHVRHVWACQPPSVANTRDTPSGNARCAQCPRTRWNLPLKDSFPSFAYEVLKVFNELLNNAQPNKHLTAKEHFNVCDITVTRGALARLPR